MSLPAKPRMSPAARHALWSLGVTQIVCWGTLFYGMMILGPRIQSDTGWSATLVYGGFSVALLVAGVAAPRVGAAIDRTGGRPVMALGAVIGGAGFLLLGLSYHLAVYLLAFVLIGLGMAGTLYDAAFATLARIAGPEARRTISALTLMGGLASTIFWPIGFWLLRQMDWRMVAFVYAALVGILCALIHALLPHEEWQAPALTEGPPPAAEPPPLVPMERRNLVLMGFSLAVIAHGVVTNALSAHLAPTLDMLGLTEGQAIFAGALIGPAQSAARLVEMMLSGRYPVLALGLISVGLMPLAFAILVMGGFGFNALVVFALVYGASNGLLTIARGVLPLAMFGRAGYGRVLGVIGGPALVAKACAPLLFTWVVGLAGPHAAILGMAGLSLVAFLAMGGMTLVVRGGVSRA